ncbi:MAG: phosphatidylserine decarboxylase [Anaerolineae bacterium]|nr:phosphatidylserine decarboxylase [Anaerolineae bacterium]
MEKDRTDRFWPFAQGGGPTIALATGLWTGVLSLWRAKRGAGTGVLFATASVVWLLILYFFRDPNRPLYSEPGLVMSAADGKVVAITRETEPIYLKQDMLRISTFLDITDVHVQRIPIDGVVRRIITRSGKFLQAFRPEASTENESIAMELETPYGAVLVKQIAGIMARRCVNYASVGEQVISGERYGLIRFGSRVDLFLPVSAEVLVAEGDRVAGGLTPVARLRPVSGSIHA